jgi:hypothetical protein
MARTFRVPRWAIYVIVAIFIAGVAYSAVGTAAVPMCPGSQVYCPGVGCMSGQDKCFAAGAGGATRVFSHETFKQWPGKDYRATPPEYTKSKETFVSKKCPDGTRSDGPCLMEFPTF